MSSNLMNGIDCKHKLLFFLHSLHFDRPKIVMAGLPLGILLEKLQEALNCK
jgi:hypothetical protein